MMRCGLLMGLLLVGSVAARDRNSHIPISPSTDGLSVKQLLDQKLGDLKTQQLLRDMMRNPLSIDPKLREQLLKSPAAIEIMRRLRDGDESLLRLVEQLAADHPYLKQMDRRALRSGASELARQYTAGSPGIRQPPGMPLHLPERTQSFDDAERAAQKIFNEQIHDLMREWKMEGLAEQLRDTPAFRDLLQDIARNGMKPFQLPGGMSPQQLNVKSLVNFLSKVRRYLPKNLPGLSGLRGPAVPSTLSNFSFGRPSMPSVSTPGFGEGWSAIVTVVMFGCGIGLLWWVIRWKPRRAMANRNAIRVHPDAVNSWPDLIRAFEALAINRFGQTAAHWHHRRIEKQLAAGSDRHEVEKLANLYEHGRYAAHVEPVNDWQPIREGLRRLAGDSK